jgi:hypothetical protein
VSLTRTPLPYRPLLPNSNDLGLGMGLPSFTSERPLMTRTRVQTNHAD